MYKDPEKQREAVRLATQRYRLKLKGITVVTESVIPVIPISVIPLKPFATTLAAMAEVESGKLPARFNTVAEMTEDLDRRDRPPLTKSEQVKGSFKEFD